MKTRLFSLALGFAILNPPQAHAGDAEQAQMLLSYFSAGCSSQGEWSRAALAQATAVLETLKSARDDQDCKSLSGAISQVSILQGRLQSLTLDEEERQIQSARRRQQELLLQLSSTTDEAEALLISELLRATQVELAGYLGYHESGASFRRDQRAAESYGQLVTHTRVLLQQMLANSACTLRQPGLLSGVASLAGAVGSAAATSGTSIAVAAGVDLLGAVVEFARTRGIQKHINRIADVLSSSAYQCALESLSNQFCSAQDALEIVQSVSDSLETPATSKDPLLEGMRLQARELGAVLDWLAKVRAGTPPSNVVSAERAERFTQRRQLVEGAKFAVEGILAENQVLYDSIPINAPDRQTDQWVVVRNTILAAITKITGSSSPGVIVTYTSGNPFTEVLNSDYAPYFLLGMRQNEVPKSNGQMVSFSFFDPKDPSHWDPTKPFEPKFNEIRSRLQDWMTRAQALIMREFVIVTHPDPLQILHDAAIDLHGPSAYDSLIAIASFLERQKPESWTVGSHALLYQDTANRLKEIAAKLKTSLERTTPYPEDPQDSEHPRSVLLEIYNLAALDHDIVFIAGRIETSLRIAFHEELLKKDDPKSRNAAARLLAAEDVLDELQRYSGTTDLTSIKRQLEKSQWISTRTTQTFVDAFAPGIKKVLESHWKEANASVNPRTTLAAAEGAELCLKLLATPRWPKKIPFGFCDGAFLQSSFRKGPDSVKVTRKELARPYAMRACRYRDFIRENYIYQEHRTHH